MKLDFGIVEASWLLPLLMGTDRAAHLIHFFAGSIRRQLLIPLSVFLGLGVNPQHPFELGILFPLCLSLLLL